MTIRFRRNTAAAAASSNPVLAAGEPGFATDTGDLKIGDGVKAWTALSPLLTEAKGNSTYAPIGSVGGGGISLDTDGVPYYDPAGTGQLALDTDNVPYLV